MVDYEGDILTVVVVTMALAAIFVVLRLVARYTTRVKLWWDDYLGILAFLFALAWSAVVLQCE